MRDVIISGDIGMTPLSPGGSTRSGWTPSDGRSASSMGTVGKNPAELGVRVTTTIDLHHDKT